MTHPDDFKLVRLGIHNAICERHCSVCEGQDHHWLEDCDDDTGAPIIVCKHCDVYDYQDGVK